MTHKHLTLISTVLIASSIALTFGCKKQGTQISENAELKQLSAEFHDMANKIKSSLNDKELVITFDDGPITKGDACLAEAKDRLVRTSYSVPEKPTSHFTTSDLIDYLNYHHVPATFFVIANSYYSHHTNACAVRRIIRSPKLLIANHTWTHKSIAIDPKTCDNTSNIPQTSSYRPLPEHWEKLFSHNVLKQYLQHNLVQTDPNPEQEIDTTSTNSTSLAIQQTPENPLPAKPPFNFMEAMKKGWSIFPRIGQGNHFVAVNPPEKTSKANSHSHPMTMPLPDNSPYKGYSKFITNEVEASACYLNQYLLLYSESEKIAQEYPLFYRPPGGFWFAEDKIDLLNHPSMKSYIGPIAWHYGGSFDGRDVSDYECWKYARQWEESSPEDTEIRNEILAKSPPTFIQGLKEGNPEKGCSDSYIARIESQPEGQKKGIVLLHDNQPQTIRMFIEYLYPELITRGYKIIGLDQVPVVKEELMAINAHPSNRKKLGSCVPAKDLWCQP